MIDNYDSFTWNLYQYLNQSKLCEKVDVFRNDKIDIETIEREINPDIIFISPGPGHPKTDSGISRDLIEHYKGKKPIVGVCMGQQCIFEVFGGDVSYAGEIVHGKTTSIKHDGKAGSLKSLPDCLEVTATTETAPEVIMGVRHKKYTIEGVQFHPESILTESGQLMIDNLLSFSADNVSKTIRLLKIYLTLDQTIILSEFKRASPSKGDINTDAHPGTQASTYASFGCSTISVLTEPKWFKGSLDDLSLIRKVIDSPENASKDYKRPAVLRKEFIFNKYQILEARLAGADTVLLIVKMLKDYQLLHELYEYSLSLGMVPLVEVNDSSELEDAVKLTYKNDTKEPLIIGVNNRNLTTFDVDLNTTSSLVTKAKNNSGRKGDVLVLALSGITSVDDVKKYKYEDNVDGFLIGESLMRAEEKGKAGEFLHALTHA
ncbi:hypothetical protein QCA50_019476 [Cerrena zonata]|uniref:Multifunctional tryptophan biosynthesis protein n=1 Tax=Cerrena zonata TaxID=2478898 RepID=A0AAW0FEE6_9APHY